MSLNDSKVQKPFSHNVPSQQKFQLENDEAEKYQKPTVISKSKQTISQYPLGDLSIALSKMQESKSKHQSEFNLNVWSDIHQFSGFGPSVYLYFQFLRKIIIVFIILSVLSLIPISYNAIHGTTYSSTAYGINVAFAQTTIGAYTFDDSSQTNSKTVNIVIISLNIFILFAYWLYWKKFTLEESNRIENQLKLSNNSSIVVEMNQVQASQEELQHFFEKFEKVTSIEKVVDMKNVLYYGKRAVELKETNRVLKAVKEVDSSSQKLINNQILENQQSIDYLEKQLVTQIHDWKKEQIVVRYFVAFEDQESQKRILDIFGEYEGCCSPTIPQEMLLNNQKLHIERQQCQPYQIYWENQSVKTKQKIVPNILLIVFINLFTISALILIGLLLTSTRPVYYSPTFQTNNEPFSVILQQTNQTIIDSWCLNTHETQQNQSLCNPVYTIHNQRILTYFIIAFLLLLTKFFVKRVVLFIKPYLRYKSKVEQSKQIMMHLFINYTLISIIITLSIQTNLFGSSIRNIFISCVQDMTLKQHYIDLKQYYDYTSEWYLQYGFQLTVNFIVMIIFPHLITPLIEAIILKVNTVKAEKQKLQVLMDRCLELNEFELQDHYASMLSLICTGVIFAGNIPLMLPLVLLTLIARYLSTKYLFLNWNRPPVLTDRTLANKIPSILLFIITGYLLNSIWSLGVQTIFSPPSNLFNDRGINSNSNAHNPLEAVMVFLKRLACSWQPAMIYVIGIFLILCRKILFKMLMKIANRNASKSQAKPTNLQFVETAPSNFWFSHISAEKSSYQIEKKIEYHKIMQYIKTIG